MEKVVSLIFAVGLMINILGCGHLDNYESKSNGNNIESVQTYDRNMRPIDPDTFTSSQEKWIDLSKSFYDAELCLSGEMTDLDKARFFVYIISCSLYESKLEQWKSQDGYAVPLSEIKKVIFTHLSTSDFNPINGFSNLTATRRYDKDKEMYITDSIGGYGGASALGVLKYTENEDKINIIIGSYDMEAFFSDPPIYTLNEIYETEFLVTGEISNFKVLKARKGVFK